MATIDTNQLSNIGVSGRPQSTDKGKLGQEQFLKLMVTQIQNQDPFKPMENGDFLAQIAQFGTVSGIQDLQNSFSSLSNSLVSNQALQASSLVGRSIVVETQNFRHTPGNNLNGLVGLHTATDSLSVDIMDNSNQVVRSIKLGSNSAGVVNFIWDGKNEKGQIMPAGEYKMLAKANVGGSTIAMQTLVSEKVDSVTLGTGQQGLLVNTTSNNTYSFSNVKQVK